MFTDLIQQSDLRDALVILLTPLFGLAVGLLRKFTSSPDVLINVTGCMGAILLAANHGYMIIPYTLNVIITWLLLRYRSKDRRVLMREVLGLQWAIILILNTLSMFYDVKFSHYSSPFMLQLVRAQMTVCGLQYHDREQAGEELTHQQKRCVLSRIPSLREFISYSFYFATIAYGPSIEFVEWRAFMDGPEAEAARPLDKLSARAFSHRIPFIAHSRVFSALVDLLCGAIGAILHTTWRSTPFHASYIASPAFLEHGPIFRLVATPILHRIFASGKYLCAWAMTASGTTLAGFGKREGIWDAFRSIEPSGYIGPSFSEMNVAWNLSINAWLRYYVYAQVSTGSLAQKLPPVVQLLIPYTVSALWHGFDWFYFATFIPSAFAAYLARDFRHTFTVLERRLSRKIGRGTPLGLAVDVAYFIVCTLCSQWIYGYMTFFFPYRGNALSLQAMRRLYFLGYLIILVGVPLPWRLIGSKLGITKDELKLLSAERGWCIAQYKEEKRRMLEAEDAKSK